MLFYKTDISHQTHYFLRKSLILAGVVSFFMFLFFLTSTPLQAQNVGLQIPKKLTDGTWNLSLLHRPDPLLRFDLSTNLAETGSRLKIGRSPNVYDLVSVPITSNRVEFSPSSLGLSPGRYFVRVTNSEATSTRDITTDTREGLLFSNEVVLAVEASSAPSVIGPRGTTTSGAPLFEWNEVPGVVAYWVIFSSTPFEIRTDENDDISIEGANLVWQYITTETSALYGSINENIGTQPDSPPLDPGREYSYSVLNMYDENSPAYASAVFGGVIPMLYENPNAIPKTRLIAPLNEEEINAASSITFRWSSVPEAANYTFNMYEVITQQGVDATVPIYSTTTNNTLLDYPALANLKNSRYLWNVVANDGKGGGSTSGNSVSPNNAFVFNVPSGSFNASVKSTTDGSTISGANIIARAISGGVTPPNPFFLQAGSISENLVVGTYEFTAEKRGFQSNKVTVTIQEDRTSGVQLQLTPLPSFFSGTAVDQTGSAVVDAKVRLRNSNTGAVIESTTNNQGLFGLYADAGSYVFLITKAGYISPATEAIRLLQNEQRLLDNPVRLTNDQATLSGYILNENSSPISLGKVIATNSSDGSVQEARTLDNGFYQFILSSGDWILTAEKTGFVVDNALRISISGGDVLSNQNLRMNGRANQVTGFVNDVIQNENGTTGFAPLENVRIVATPASGAAVSTLTKRNGQYTLNLKRGGYSLSANLDRYRPGSSLELVLGNGETVSGLDFELSPNPSSVSGLVRRPDGTLLRDVTVMVNGIGQVNTSSDGAFRISVPAGTHQISATRAGFVQPPLQTVNAATGENLTGITFTLFPNASVVQGSVTTRGETVIDAIVTATPTSGGAVKTSTNNFGEYTLNLKPGKYTIQTLKNGFVSSPAKEVVLSAGQVLRGFNQTLVSNTVTLRGSVLASGTPLRDVTVIVSSATRPDYTENTRTLVNGTYALNVEAGHAYVIEATRTGYRSGSQSTERLSAGEDPVNLTLNLNPAPAQISGRITDPLGLPLSNVTINIRNQAGELVEQTKSLNDGRYTMASPTGTYSLRAILPGYLGTVKPLNISPGQNLTNVDFKLSENFSQLKGRIVSESGTPIQNASIRLVSSSGQGGANAVTGQSGVYNLGRLLDGYYEMSVSAQGYLAVENISVQLISGQPVTLNRSLISASGVIGGSVRDVNGNTINEATVSAISPSGSVIQTLSGSDGSFQIDGIRPESYTLEALKAGYTLQETATVALSEGTPIVNNVLIDALIRSIGQVSALVLSDTGVPVSGVVFSLSGTNGSASAVSGSDGRFVITNLPLGNFDWSLSGEGFSTTSGTITLTEQAPSLNLDLNMIENDGVVTGRVRDQQGAALPTPVEVRLLFDDRLVTQRTNSAGEFRFVELPKNADYIFETAVQSDGLNDATLSFTFPPGIDEFTPENDIQVVFNNNIITGNVGLDNVTVQLLYKDGELVDTQISQDDGSYIFRFIPAGNFVVVANRQGYVFNPSQLEITNLGYSETRSANFSGQINAGTINVQIQDEAGTEVSGVNVFLTDTGNTLVLNRNTTSTGLVAFKDLPAGKDYLISTTKEGFTAIPSQLSTSLNVGETLNLSVELRANNSSLSGNVLRTDTNAGLREASVQVINEQFGTSQEVTTSAGGVFSLNSIQSGSYTVIASATGFIGDTLRNQQIAPEENKTGVSLGLAPASLSSLSGLVVYKGSGLAAVKVEVSGITSVNVTTGNNGAFSVPNFPILTGNDDNTSIVATYTFGNFTESQIISVPGSSAGSAFSFPEVEIPSGRLNGTVTNGMIPISGADVTITQATGGDVIQLQTDVKGAFATDEDLRRGEYQLTVSAPNVLLPDRSRSLSLDSSSDQVESFFRLPYRFRSDTEVTATDSAIFKIAITPGYLATGVEAVLEYRKEQETTFTATNFTRDGDTLYAVMPASGGIDPLIYKVWAKDNINPEGFASPEIKVDPLPVDILNAITLSPSPEGLRLRAGDAYPFTVQIRDGVNRSMTSRFAGNSAEGILEISTGSEQVTVSTAGEAPIFSLSTPFIAGPLSLTITARYNGQVFNRKIRLEVSEAEVSAIQVSRPARTIPNKGNAVFSYRAEDADGQQVLLGGNGTWNINSLSISAQHNDDESVANDKLGISRKQSSEVLGTINSSGIFSPQVNTIGQFSVSYTDSQTGIVSTSDPVNLIAQITTDQAIQLSNGEGFMLDIPSGSLQPNTQVRLSYRTPEAAKKYVVAKGTDISLVTSEEIFVVNYSGGDPSSPVTITLPEPFDMSLNDGNRRVGYFDQRDLQWELYTTTAYGNSYSTNEVSRLGQFALLVENQMLGIDMVRILPNPFSPDVAPVKIGYVLSTDAPPAFVTLKIFNMNGQIVKTLLDEDPQQPGKYGSESSLKEITWDGITDNGLMARNGRYILQIVARDTKDKVETLKTIVLVK